jgi:hypothetical protein
MAEDDASRSFAGIFGSQGEGTWSRGGARDDEPGFGTLFAPIAPFNRWPFLSPVVAVAGAAAIFALTGIAAAALVVMSLALLAVVFLLTQVFGYEIVLPNMPNMPNAAR